MEEMIAHARETAPAECCGLVGGRLIDGGGARATSVYRLRNAARNPLTSYEAAPEDLFAAQRTMRERGEEMVAIYHSHPRAVEPVPSPADVQLAFYPSAVYLIIALGGEKAILSAFRLFESENRWERVRFEITGGDE